MAIVSYIGGILFCGVAVVASVTGQQDKAYDALTLGAVLLILGNQEARK